MKFILVQLSDIHFAKEKANPILDKAEKIAELIKARASSCNAIQVIIICNGDIANWGFEEEFVLGSKFFGKLTDSLSDFQQTQIFVAGNHDCDFSGNQKIRDRLIEDVDSSQPDDEILEHILTPLNNYFAFVEGNVDWQCINRANPLAKQFQVHVKGKPVLNFNLINSAWMSQEKEESGGLAFPLEKIVALESQDCLTFSVIHHPLNWFEQNHNSMRGMRDALDSKSDFVLTGHEHCQNATTKTHNANEAGKTTYVEAGVLQEVDDAKLCTFNVFEVDTDSNSIQLEKFSWCTDGFFDSSTEFELITDPARRHRQQTRRSLSVPFRQILYEIDLPFSSARGELTLAEIFVLPDLRERTAKTSNWKRVRSTDIRSTIETSKRILLTGPEMCGKSCLAKVLFRQFHADGKTPLLLDASSFGKVFNAKNVENAIKRSLKVQYQKLSFNEFQQLPRELKVVFVDNLNRTQLPNQTYDKLIESLTGVFEYIMLVGGDEFWLYDVNQDVKFEGFRKLEVCEFGHIKIEELASKWHSIGTTSEDFDAKVVKTTKLLESVLASEVIPQYPWIILALLQESETSEEIAAKNGSFGHLYQSLIVAALARDPSPVLDIQGKITYLSELAIRLFHEDRPTFDDSFLNEFHSEHCKKYAIDLERTKTIDGFISCGVLADRAGEYFFKAKFSFCFFVAWYFSKNIHKSKVRKVLQEICNSLDHVETANILVFLAHLCNDPIIVLEILSAADHLFETSTETDFVTDVNQIQLLSYATVGVKLPESKPEENRRAIAEQKDERALTKSKNDTDGRNLVPKPKGLSSDSKLGEIVGSLKAIQILGQVLRNGMASLESGKKKKITRTVYALARRMLGQMFADVKEVEKNALHFIAEHQEQIDGDQKMQDSLDRAFDVLFWTAHGVGAGITARVAQSVGLGLLERTFSDVLKDDPCIPNKVFDLAIRIEHSKDFPVNKIIETYSEFADNQYVCSILRMMVSRQLHIRNVPHDQDQRICSKLGIERSSKSKSQLNPQQKLTGRR